MHFYSGVYILLTAVVIGVSCECGIEAPRTYNSVLDWFGIGTKIFPWHVLIYNKLPTSNSYVNICSGTLISPNVVISSAHCFYQGDFPRTGVGASSLIIRTGEQYNIYNPNQQQKDNVQIAGVETIHVAEEYQGIDNSFAGDIVWFVLEQPFNITSWVRPVCVDFNNQRGREEIQTGTVGKLNRVSIVCNEYTNWQLVECQCRHVSGISSIFQFNLCNKFIGRMSMTVLYLVVGFKAMVDGPPSPELGMIDLIAVSYTDCFSMVLQKSRHYVTTDKICGHFRDRDVFHFISSGSGFYIQRNNHWYLVGVMGSNRIILEETRTNHFLLPITNIMYFVEMERNKIMKNCGVVESPARPLIINGFTPGRGSFPWHVAVYRKKSTGYYDPICGGTLISSSVVISAAHCFYNDVTRTKLDASSFAVAAGKYYRHYNWPEAFAQKSNVETIHLPSRYYGMNGNYAEDIAWLILQRPFNSSTFVKPICVDSYNSYEREDLQVGSVGKVVGWGRTEAGNYSNELQEMSVPFVPHAGCVSSVPPDFVPFLTADKFCGGYLNGTNLCDGDSGGGLAFYRNERWYLRGIVSVAPHNRVTCNSYTAFTNVGHFIDYINSFINVTSNFPTGK